MNLANKLTILRIFLVPVFLVFIVSENIPYGTIIATILFIIASITDKLDGYIARSRNQITTFGKFMDPLADKLLVTSALVALVEFHIIPSWTAMIIIAREFAVSGLRTIAASEGIVLAASKLGKLKTVTQIITIVIMLIKVNISYVPSMVSFVEDTAFLNAFFTYAPNILLTLAVIITIVSGVDYFVKNSHVFNFDK